MAEAIELVQLICAIERHKRPETEFFLIYRKDCPLYLGREFEKLVSRYFGRCAARQARNHDSGYPGGCNMLAASAMMEISILRREGLCLCPAFLLFEADCVPLTLDWIDSLSAEWDRVSALGKEAFGHWHNTEHPDYLHLNGNAVFSANFFDRHPDMMIGPATQGWDFFFRQKYIALSVDSNLIFQQFQRYGISLEELAAIQKGGLRPALLHGIKTPDGRACAQQLIFAKNQPLNCQTP